MNCTQNIQDIPYKDIIIQILQFFTRNKTFPETHFSTPLIQFLKLKLNYLKHLTFQAKSHTVVIFNILLSNHVTHTEQTWHTEQNTKHISSETKGLD